MALDVIDRQAYFRFDEDAVCAGNSAAEFGRRHGLRAASSVRFALDSLLKDELHYRRDDGYVVYDRLFAEWLRA